jgi:hypothetical protein
MRAAAGIRRPPPYIDGMDDLELRVEEALAIARSCEAAAVSIGAAALDAAEQARRAAKLAERASLRLAAHAPASASAAPAAAEDEGLRSFEERADRVAIRLRRLEHAPVPAAR